MLEDGSVRTHDASGTFEIEDVVVPISGSESRYPPSGTIRRSMTATRTTPDGTETRDVEIVITFDGTAIASLAVNGEALGLKEAKALPSSD